jgi:hypothetical protein
LILELLVWVAARPRSYEETMGTWRTSCPRNPVWEDATTDGLIEVLPGVGRHSATVRLTPSGRARGPSLNQAQQLLQTRRPALEHLIGATGVQATEAFGHRGRGIE